MAVTWVNTNTMQNGTGNFSGSMTVNSGATLAICVVGFADTSQTNISSVTYGGQTMTAVGAKASLGSGLFNQAQAFYLVNPPTGSNTLAVNFVSSPSAGYYINLVAFSGNDSSTPIRPGTYQAIATTTSTTADVTITSTTSDITVSLIEIDAVVTTNQTLDGTNTGGAQAGASDHCTTPATSVLHSWSVGTTQGYALVGFSIQPPTSPQDVITVGQGFTVAIG